MGSYSGGWCLWVVTGEGGVCGQSQRRVVPVGSHRGGWCLWVVTVEGGVCG